MTSTLRITFVGDSITDAGRDRDDATSFGDGYVSLVSRKLANEGVAAEIRNAGVSGDRVVDLQRRWAADVSAYPADVLSVYVGVNDTWRRFDADDPTTAADFEERLRSLVAPTPVAVDAPRLILVEPFVLPVRPEQTRWLDDLAEKRAAVRRLASETAATFVPLHDTLTREAERVGAAALAPDGVHPTPRGSLLIADAWWNAWRTIAPGS